MQILHKNTLVANQYACMLARHIADIHANGAGIASSYQGGQIIKNKFLIVFKINEFIGIIHIFIFYKWCLSLSVIKTRREIAQSSSRIKVNCQPCFSAIFATRESPRPKPPVNISELV